MKEVTSEVLTYKEDVLERTVESHKDFISSFSHEALSPIQVIRTGIESVMNSDDISIESHDALLSSAQAIDMLRTSLESMRLLFQTSGKPLDNQFREIDLHVIVSRWCKIFKEQFDGKNIQIIQEPVIGKWNVRAIPEAMDVMIRNLVSNAVKYSFDAKKVPDSGKFLVRFDQKTFRLCFINFGIPIPEDDLIDEKIFIRGKRGLLSSDRGKYPVVSFSCL